MARFGTGEQLGGHRLRAVWQCGIRCLDSPRLVADAAERLDEAQRYLTERVQERPLQSTGIALGVGVILGLLLAGRRR